MRTLASTHASSLATSTSRTGLAPRTRAGASTARRCSAALTAFAFTCTTLASSLAGAQEQAVSPDGKGIVGGALLGAEVGTIIESIAGVHSPWVYVVTDLVLGAGGAVGGWAVEQQVENSGWDVRVPVFMLAGGLGLIIPAVVLTLNGTRYQPAENASEDHAPTNAPPANPGAPNGSIVSPAATPPPAVQPAAPPAPGGTSSLFPSNVSPARAAAHVSLFDVNAEGMHLGVPVPEVRPLFTMSELRQYGLTQQTEVRMPLVKVSF
jgi:hypothetical protein